jgi:hypothetical protein
MDFTNPPLITRSYLRSHITSPQTSQASRQILQDLELCLYGDFKSEEVPNGEVCYACKYVQYEECRHFGVNFGAQACVEMKKARAKLPRGSTMLKVERMRESCKSCKEKERRKEWKERGRYWRGLE